MKANVRFNIDNIVEADPVKIRQRHPNSNYEFFYKICISIPITISFSLIFFMIFYISPRGEAMQLFQKGIYEWNKERLADHMGTLSFKYSISPHADPALDNIEGFLLKHTDEDSFSTSQSTVSTA